MFRQWSIVVYLHNDRPSSFAGCSWDPRYLSPKQRILQARDELWLCEGEGGGRVVGVLSQNFTAKQLLFENFDFVRPGVPWRRSVGRRLQRLLAFWWTPPEPTEGARTRAASCDMNLVWTVHASNGRYLLSRLIRLDWHCSLVLIYMIEGFYFDYT